MAKNTPAFLPRKLTNDELTFDPKTLKKLRVPAPNVNLESPTPARLEPHTAVALAAAKASAIGQETVRESDPSATELSEPPAPLPASQDTDTEEDQLGSDEASSTEAMYEFKVG